MVYIIEYDIFPFRQLHHSEVEGNTKEEAIAKLKEIHQGYTLKIKTITEKNEVN